MLNRDFVLSHRRKKKQIIEFHRHKNLLKVNFSQPGEKFMAQFCLLV